LREQQGLTRDTEWDRLDPMTAAGQWVALAALSALTTADLVLVLPNTDDIAVWEDNGTAGDNIHRLRSVNGTFETTTDRMYCGAGAAVSEAGSAGVS